jgi:hypothetical protein
VTGVQTCALPIYLPGISKNGVKQDQAVLQIA